MKVEEIKLAFETNVKFVNNIKEVSAIQSEVQKQFNQLGEKGKKAREILIDYEKDYENLFNKSFEYGKEVVMFAEKVKALGINEPPEVEKTIQGLISMRDAMKASYKIIKSTLMLN